MGTESGFNSIDDLFQIEIMVNKYKPVTYIKKALIKMFKSGIIKNELQCNTTQNCPPHLKPTNVGLC